MKVRELTPILNVSSLEESFAWFEKLGWRKAFDWQDGGNFGGVICGECRIFLCRDCQGPRGGPEPREPWDNQAGSTWMSWWLASPEEVDEAYALAVRHGLRALFPPENMPWNVREFNLRHPDGHTFRVSAGLPEESAP